MESSVNKLPPELLVVIFHMSLGGFTGWTFQKLHKLAKVCTRWRDIVLGTPQLWCTIQSWQYPHQIERVIKRNPLGPLMVRSNSQTWLEKIAPQSNPSRWIALIYDGQQYFPSLERIIQSTNDLRHLSIALDSRTSGSSEGIVTNLTKLHTLHLRSFNIPWDTLNSLRLESLWLENPSPCPTMDQVLSVLRSSPYLRRLILHGFYAWGERFPMWCPEEALSEPQDSSPIDLPHLETLIMGSVASSIAYPLLWRLRVPSCKTLHLDYCHVTQFATASSSELPKTIGRILVAAKQIRLRHTARNLDGTGPLELQTLDPPYLVPTLPFRVSECSGLKLTMVTQGFKTWNDLAEAIGLKDFVGATELAVGCGNVTTLPSSVESAADTIIRRIAEDMRQSISMLELMADPLPMLQYLSVPQPLTGTESVKYWPCPRLSHIFVNTEPGSLPGSNRDELLQACILVLRRSSARVGSLVVPRQLEELSSNSSLGLTETLSRMDEFRDVKFTSRSERVRWFS